MFSPIWGAKGVWEAYILYTRSVRWMFGPVSLHALEEKREVKNEAIKFYKPMLDLLGDPFVRLANNLWQFWWKLMSKRQTPLGWSLSSWPSSFATSSVCPSCPAKQLLALLSSSPNTKQYDHGPPQDQNSGCTLVVMGLISLLGRGFLWVGRLSAGRSESIAPGCRSALRLLWLGTVWGGIQLEGAYRRNCTQWEKL